MVTSLELVDRALGLATACGRPDLHRRLTLVRARVQDPGIRVLVVGEPKRGKSFLVNALVGAPVCPVADDVATRVPTVVRGGEVPRAVLVLGLRPGSGGQVADGGTARIETPLDELAARLSAPDDPGDRPLLQAEVELPRQLFEGGLQLVDTPGVGGVGSGRSLATLDLLPTADAVIVVTDASQEFTAPEMAFLRQAHSLCPTALGVVTKTDLSPDWRRIVALDEGHLRAQGVEAPLFPVASPLALLAVRANDRELYEESGLGPLVTYLRQEVVGRADVLARRSVLHDLTSVTEHLALALRSEIATLEDPAGREEMLRGLEEARAAVDELRRRSSRWQTVLNDGVTDLMNDIDFDVRDRARVVVREAEAAIDAQDPGPLWHDLAGWLDQRLAAAVADSYVWAEQRSQWLAARVVEQFAQDGGAAVPELSVGTPTEALDALATLPEIDAGVMTLRNRLLVGVRGSYSGVLMTGLVTSLAGMAVINPVSLAAGVLLGRKAYNDDRAQRIQRRQNEAKVAVRRHLDDVVFQVSKQLKDRLRTIQRTLRDLVTETVDEMARSLADAVRAAQRSANAVAAEQNARNRTLRQQLDLVERLAREAQQLAGLTVTAP